jgi:hypothetical protein
MTRTTENTENPEGTQRILGGVPIPFVTSVVTLVWLVAVLIFAAGCASLNRLLAPPETNSYFPLAENDEWDYRLVTTMTQAGRTDTTTVADYRHRITGRTKMADGRPAFIRVWTAQVTLHDSSLGESTFTQAETSYFRRTRSAVNRYATRSSAADSILLFPVQIDRQWTSGDVDYWVKSRDDITVGGRTYPECWRVQAKPRGQTLSMNVWFARGAGMVRMTSERTFGDRRLFTDYFLTRALFH